MMQRQQVLIFDTSNEVVAIGLGCLDAASRTVECMAVDQVQAHRCSNVQLLSHVDALCAKAHVDRADIACVAVGCGPGSFTGVRIAVATAKGVASALEVALLGVSTLDAVAWNAWHANVRGDLLVVADAMRKEIYPARFVLDDAGVTRLAPDCVVKVADFADDAAAKGATPGLSMVQVGEGSSGSLLITGDALVKYADVFASHGELLDEVLWMPTGEGLLLALQAEWRAGKVDPFDAQRHAPAFVLPVYTRLSDAEENERVRLADVDGQRLRQTGADTVSDDDADDNTCDDADGNTCDNVDGNTCDGSRKAIGVQRLRDSRHITMNDTAVPNTRGNESGIACIPLDCAHAPDVARIEAHIMGSDAWSEALVADEPGRRDRTWWAAYAADPAMPLAPDAPLVGYAGAWVVDGDAQILKVGVDPEWRRRGVAGMLTAQVLADARNLGAQTCSLEVRRSNEGAQMFYRALGFEDAGMRPHYYSDGEDALIMKAVISRVLSGMQENIVDTSVCQLGDDGAPALYEMSARPLILAFESSCDETAAALVNGQGDLLSNVVASQVDFHARFGGVVPEIASRKHIEAICGVCELCLEEARGRLGFDGESRLHLRDLDAVAVTYAPGLVGALVVGVAFAKGIAWAADIPLIGVNHLEGHLFANKFGDVSFEPPAVVSLVSGGNTMLVYMRDWGDYVTLGATIDDAVGEAFDKVAKALGLGYPGGPVISHYAEAGDPDAIAFPRAMMHSGDMCFSLSGLKTAVVTYVNEERAAGRELDIPDIAASFQQAVIDVQVSKARMALVQTGAPTFCLGGGVAANPALRSAYEQLCADLDVKLVMSPPQFCGDNAAMIALVALDRFAQGKFFGLDADVSAHADLDMPY